MVLVDPLDDLDVGFNDITVWTHMEGSGCPETAALSDMRRGAFLHLDAEFYVTIFG